MAPTFDPLFDLLIKKNKNGLLYIFFPNFKNFLVEVGLPGCCSSTSFVKGGEEMCL
jgi:hypothetical protein